MRLADAIKERTEREVTGPSGVRYRVRSITSMDTLLTRAPMLLASLPARPAADKRGQVLPRKGEPDLAAKAALDTVYSLAVGGVVAWSTDGADWHPVRLVEGEPGEGEEAVQVVPWGDLSVISEAVAIASGLSAEPRRALQPSGVGDDRPTGEPVRDRPVDGA